jgi:hypothetical protein
MKDTDRLPWAAPRLRVLAPATGDVPDGMLQVIVWHRAHRFLVMTADVGRIVADEPLPVDRDLQQAAADRYLRRLGLVRQGTPLTSDQATAFRAVKRP